MTTPQGSWGAAAIETFLAQVPLFQELPVSTLKAVTERFVVRSFRRGQFVFFEGDPADAFNVLGAGQVKVVRET